MKTLLKILLVFTLCLAALCQSPQNDFSLQVDALSVSISENFVPFFKVKEGDNVYYLKLQSIYEIQQQNDSLWYRIPGTETLFSALNWNVSTSLSDGTFSLFGSPCPCEDSPPQQEPVLGKRIIKGSARRSIRDSNGSNCNGNNGNNGETTPPGNQGTDNGTDTGNNSGNLCPTVRFEYIKLSFSYNCTSGGNGGNGGNNTVDPDQCNTTCASACDSATNASSCVAYCSTFYNVTYIDEEICNSTCLVNDVVDADCLVACNSWATCLNSSNPNPNPTPEEPACTLTINYHLHKYTFSNTTSDANNTDVDFQPTDSNIRLAFAFEVLQETGSVPCRSFFDNWFEGPFNVKLNVSTLALENYPEDDSNLDITNATQIESNLVYALRDDIVVGRIYVNKFADGFSIFNAPSGAISTPPANNTDNSTTTTKRNIGVAYDFPVPIFASLRKSSK